MSAAYRKSRRGRKSRRSSRGIRRRAEVQAAEVQIPLSVEALTEYARQSLHTFAIEVGLKLAECLLRDDAFGTAITVEHVGVVESRQEFVVVVVRMHEV